MLDAISIASMYTVVGSKVVGTSMVETEMLVGTSVVMIEVVCTSVVAIRVVGTAAYVVAHRPRWCAVVAGSSEVVCNGA